MKDLCFEQQYNGRRLLLKVIEGSIDQKNLTHNVDLGNHG